MHPIHDHNPTNKECSMSDKQVILIIDDNPENLRVLGDILDIKGYEVLIASSGPEAFEVIKSPSPDLILLDIMMPGMDGHEVCRKIKDDPDLSRIPVIFISALGATEPKIKAFREGAVDYITKPFHVEEVIARVQTHLQLAQIDALKHEISERKKAEEALRESEDRFRKVFDQSSEGIVLAERKSGTILYANSSLETLLGCPLEEIIAGGMPAMLGHFEDETGTKIFPLALHEQQTYHVSARTRRKDGTQLTVSLYKRSIQINENIVQYLTLTDITERVRLESEAKATQAKLINANKMNSLGMLVSGMAHEINNPNSFIMFNSSMLQGIWKDTDRVLNDYFQEKGEFSLGGLPYPEISTATRKLIEGINEGASRIKTIVADLKDFARQDRSGIVRDIDVNQLVLKAASMLTPWIKKCTSDFRLELAETVPSTSGKPQQIEQVIINLLLNALQSLPGKECAVTVSTSVSEHGQIAIAIKDEGVGMDETTLAKLSEPFFTTKANAEGTGLGLFISQSILKEHQGTLWFQSAPGKGTLATIELPTMCAINEVQNEA
jgi:PAS domain S-box-containing protein